MTVNTLELLNELIPLYHRVRQLNPALERLFPVAVVEEERFKVFDFEIQTGQYRFVTTIPMPMPIPKGVRAAFQLEKYGGKIACVVTPDVFNSREGYVTILHEFVHCYQYETCEQDLKMTLDIAKKAQEEGDFMWEIEYSFPYTAQDFIRPYSRFINGIGTGDLLSVQQARKDLRQYLGVHDYEYMLWQEWKEGFARWVENKVKKYLKMPINTGGLVIPYSRVSFYAGGAAYIQCLSEINPILVKDLRNLFAKMYDGPAFDN